MITSRKISVQVVTALLAAFAAAVLLAAMPSPAAALEWSLPAVTLSDSRTNAIPGSQQVVDAADGTTTVIWTSRDGLSGIGLSGILQARIRPAGSDTFGDVVNLSDPGQNARAPQVAVGADGTTTVVWVRDGNGLNGSDGLSGILMTSTRPAGSSTFGAAEDLSVAGQGAFGAAVAIGADGATTVVWTRRDGLTATAITQARTRPAGSATFSAAENLSGVVEGRSSYAPRIAIGADGATTVVWTHYDGFGFVIVQARTRPAGSDTFGGVEDLSTGADFADPATWDLAIASPPAVVVAADGATTVVWCSSKGSYLNGYNYIVHARTRPAGSDTFGGVVDVSTAGQYSAGTQIAATPPKVAIAADGAITVVWSWHADFRANAPAPIMHVRTRPAGSDTFGAIENLSVPRQYFAWTVAIAADGATTIVSTTPDFSATSGFYFLVQVRTRPAGSDTFSAPVDLSAAGQNANAFSPQVAVAADGAATVVWTTEADSTALGAKSSAVRNIVQARTSDRGNTKPTNLFPTPKVKISSTALISTVRLPGPGTLTQRVTRKSRGAVLTVCKTSRKAAKAGTVKLTCKLSAATRKARAKGSLRVSVKTTFTPTGGLPASKTQTVTLKRKR